MIPKRPREATSHHPPNTVEQQSEDSFPTSDPPSFSGGQTIGAPVERKTRPKKRNSPDVRAAEKKVKSRRSRKPSQY